MNGVQKLVYAQAAVLLTLTLGAYSDASFSWGITDQTVDFSGHKCTSKIWWTLFNPVLVFGRPTTYGRTETA